MNESRELARFVSDLKYEDLPPDVIARAKDLILDQVGIMLACATLPWSRIIYNYVRTWGDDRQEATIAHYGVKTKAENAVFANCSFGHGFEIDDHYPPGQSHPGCIAVPTSMVMTERERGSGRDFILGVVAGYEVMGRINKAIAPSCLIRGFHAPTSISGPFAAAAVAGKLMGYGPELMLNTLSIAGSHASGVIEYDQTGGSVKRMHAGMAASGGLRAAFIAKEGLTGPPTILEGHHGFCQAFADEYFLNEITDGLGKDFRVVLGAGYKIYCSCGAMHSGLDAMRILMDRHGIKAEDVEEVMFGSNKQTISHVSATPIDITSAQFSAPFGIALTLIRGGNGFNDYTEETLRDQRLHDLAAKVRMVVDDEIQSEYPAKRGTRVTVRLKNGATYAEKVAYCKGLPQNPLSSQELEDKFRGLAAVVATGDRMDQLLETVYSLDKLKDISRLITLMNSNPRRKVAANGNRKGKVTVKVKVKVKVKGKARRSAAKPKATARVKAKSKTKTKSKAKAKAKTKTKTVKKPKVRAKR